MSIPPSLSGRSRDRDTLVAVVTTDHDLARFRDERWYRLPDRVLGRSLARNVFEELTTLAIYQTAGVTEGLPGAVELWGEISAVDSLTRRELLPDEPNHPAASQLYHRICFSEIHRLQRPLTSQSPRRVTFLRTVRERLLIASDLSDLIIGTPAQEELVKELQGIHPRVERKVYMQVSDEVVEVDIGIFAEEYQLGILLEDSSSADQLSHVPPAWNVLRFSPERIEHDFQECLREIMEMMNDLRKR